MKVALLAIACMAVALAMPSDLAEHYSVPPSVVVDFENAIDVLNPPEAVAPDSFAVSFPNVEPAIQGGVSAEGIRTILSAVIPVVLAKVKEMDFPAESGTASGFHYEIKDIKMHRLSMQSVTSSIKDGISIAVNGIDVALSLHWSYKKTKIHIPKGSGTADVSVSAHSLGATFQINTIQTPRGIKPQVRVSACNVDLSNLNIKVHGSILSFLYNLIISLFKGKLKSAIESTVRAGFIQAIDQMSDTILATMPTYAAISKWGTIDFGLTQGAAYFPAQGAAMLSFNGEVYPISTNSSAGLPRDAMPYAPSGRHMDVNFNVFTLNTAAAAWMKAGGLNKYINDDNKPPSWPIPLRADAWALFLPQLQAAFPNAPLLLHITTPEAPKVSANPGQFSLGGAFNVDVMAATSAGNKLAFSMRLNLDGGMSLKLEQRATGPFFTPQIVSTKIAATTTASNIGNVPVASVASVLDSVVNFIVIPMLNGELLNGFPLPSVAGLSFNNPVFSINKNYISFGSDLAFHL